MRESTIKKAIVKVLEDHSPLSLEEIYEKIIEYQLYDFGAKKPLSVLNIEIKRSSIGTNYSKPYQIKLFQILYNGKIKLLDGNIQETV